MRRVGVELRKSHERRLREGFYEKYLGGAAILDIGFKGDDPKAVPITETAVGIDVDYPGYDGLNLPFPEGSQDAVVASHVLEHVEDPLASLAEWFRVLKTGGYLVVFVPHQYLYELSAVLPSKWNGDHKRFYTPARLLADIEASLPVNSYRMRHLADNDADYDYSRDINLHPAGCYEIELVAQKIRRPAYSIFLSRNMDKITRPLDDMICETVAEILCKQVDVETAERLFRSLGVNYLTPWRVLLQRFKRQRQIQESRLAEAIGVLLSLVNVDEEWYVAHYPDLQRARESGLLPSPTHHWRAHGYFEGRLPRAPL